MNSHSCSKHGSVNLVYYRYVRFYDALSLGILLYYDSPDGMIIFSNKMKFINFCWNIPFLTWFYDIINQNRFASWSEWARTLSVYQYPTSSSFVHLITTASDVGFINRPARFCHRNSTEWLELRKILVN